MKRIFLFLSAFIFVCPVHSQSWNLSGNSGTNPAIHFIGTTDFTQLRFRVLGDVGGEIHPAAYKTGFGYQSSAFAGNFSTNVGARSLEINRGNFNTGIGYSSMAFNGQGTENTAFGANTLYNNKGVHNTAVGVSALSYLYGIYGNYNTAVGVNTLYYTSNSQYNTAVGDHAGFTNDLGWNNTLIGAGSNVQVMDPYNMVGIGHNARCPRSSSARIGNTATRSIGGYAGWTNFSDGRFKKNIQENVKGIEFIMKLRPVTYHLDLSGASKQSKENEWDESMKKEIAEKEKVSFSGFIAQEVEASAKEAGYDFSGVDKPGNEQAFYGLRYAEFVVPLVKTLQEQQQTIKKLQARIAALDKVKTIK